MARQNVNHLYARISKEPNFKRNEDGDIVLGMCYIQVVRGVRDARDGQHYIKYDKPLVMSREKEILDKMANWKKNDIVQVKGMIVTKQLKKASYCPYCTDEAGDATKNAVQGNLVYINPIHVTTIRSYGEDKKAAIEDILANREISNQVYVYGTLINDPKLFITKSKLRVTQYQIALNRHFRIRTDDANIKTDWPWVKTYGEQAVEDKLRLRQSSDVVIDGYLQARTVQRGTVCKCCQKQYRWKDTCMEIVPFEVEYVKGTYLTDDDLKAEGKQNVDEIRAKLFNSVDKDEMEEEYNSEEFNEE